MGGSYWLLAVSLKQTTEDTEDAEEEKDFENCHPERARRGGRSRGALRLLFLAI